MSSVPTRAASVALLLTAGLAAPARAQTSAADPSDVQTWFGTTVEADLPNGWVATLQYRGRMVDNGSVYRGSYLTAEGNWGALDWLDLMTGYRLAFVEGGVYHRVAVGAEAIHSPGSWRFSLRPVLQHQKQTFPDDDEQSGDEATLLRTRVRARYRPVPVVDLYASTEPYFAFGAEYPVDNWRNTVGAKYALTEAVAVDLFYIYRPDYAKSYNRTFHVIGIDLEVLVGG